jgi:hypothetical protein
MMMLLLTSTLLLADDDTDDANDANNVNDADDVNDANDADADDADDERRRRSSIEERKESRLDTSLDRAERLVMCCFLRLFFSFYQNAILNYSIRCLSKSEILHILRDSECVNNKVLISY